MRRPVHRNRLHARQRNERLTAESTFARPHRTLPEATVGSVAGAYFVRARALGVPAPSRDDAWSSGVAVLLALFGVGAVLIAVAAAPLKLEARLRVPSAVLRRRVDVAFVGLALVSAAAISWVVAGAST